MTRVPSFLLPALLLVALATGCAGSPRSGVPLPEPDFEDPDLDRMTTALERFRDPDVAGEEGYELPGSNDGFQMGEHWFHGQRLEDGRCELERPDFLQYLVVEGERRLIGTGYVCDAAGGPPPWFDDDVTWHTHGPALCRWPRGAFMDFEFWAKAMPNDLTGETWQDLCDDWWGTPVERPVVMLHTWNWIEHPDGPYVHENRAIPFRRAGLRVPARSFLDSDEGAAAIETLRLAHGEAGRRWMASFPVVDAGLLQKWRILRIARRARSHGEDLVEQMRQAEREDLPDLYRAASLEGRATLERMNREVLAVYEPEQRPVAEDFRASLRVHDHDHTDHGTLEHDVHHEHHDP